jgi:hypothetical protein
LSQAIPKIRSQSDPLNGPAPVDPAKRHTALSTEAGESVPASNVADAESEIRLADDVKCRQVSASDHNTDIAAAIAGRPHKRQD